MSEFESPDPHEQSADMADESEILRQWLKKGLAKRGKTQAGCAKALGYASHSSVVKMMTGEMQIKASQLPAISAYIEEPIPLQFVTNVATPQVAEYVFFAGNIDSAIWRDAAVGQALKETHIPKYPVEPYLSVRQEAYWVKKSPEDPNDKRGKYVLAVVYEDVGLIPQDGDTVVTIEEQPFQGRILVRTTLRDIVDRGGTLFAQLKTDEKDRLPIGSTKLRYVIGEVLYNARVPRR